MFCANATERRISFSLSPVLLLLVEWLSKLILICKTKGLLCYCFWLMDSFHFSIKNVPLWSLLFQKYSTANFENPWFPIFISGASEQCCLETNKQKKTFWNFKYSLSPFTHCLWFEILDLFHLKTNYGNNCFKLHCKRSK